jgi:hypothetical protein
MKKFTAFFVLALVYLANPAGAEETCESSPKDRLDQLACDLDALEKRKQDDRDQRYVQADVANFFLGSAQFQASFGYTDNDGTLRAAEAAPVQLKDTQVANARIGYFSKPIARDLRFLIGGLDEIRAYRAEGAEDPGRVVFWDAVKFDAYIGYGDVVRDQDHGERDETERSSFRYIGLRYELPLERALCEIPWAPLCGAPWR